MENNVLTARIQIDKEWSEVADTYLHNTPWDCDESPNSTIFGWGGTFDDGYDVIVFLKSDLDDFYVECALYDDEGCEVQKTTSSRKELGGRYQFLYNGKKYIVEVVTDDSWIMQ